MPKGFPIDSKVTEKDVKDALFETFGNAAAAARKLGISRPAFFVYLKNHPNIAAYRREIIDIKPEYFLDTIETVMDYCLSQVKDQTRIALDAAKYMGDKLGHIRGWGVAQENKTPNENILILEDQLTKSEYEKQQLEKELNALKSKTDSKLQRSDSTV